MAKSCVLVCFLIVLVHSEAFADGGIDLPKSASACVKWASDECLKEMSKLGLTLPESAVTVRIKPGDELPAESFSLKVSQQHVDIVGGDDVGAMYGIFELTEQLRNSGCGNWSAAVKKVKSTTQRPSIPYRADNAFVKMRPYPFSRVEMWKSYIDMLAKNRFNYIDIHGIYDVNTTRFLNLFAYIVPVEGFERIAGVDPKKQARAFADFKEIADHAGKRGVRLSFMNYKLSWSRFRDAGEDRAKATEDMAGYTALALAKLLKASPSVCQFGFRIGESGTGPEFLKKSFLKGYKLSGRDDVRLYVRTWATRSKHILDLQKAFNENSSGRHMMDLEIKYNGEQLGLPYHAVQMSVARTKALKARHKSAQFMSWQLPSYSYEDYIKNDREYGIIWQIRSNGTHRFWPWAYVDNIRRVMKSVHFGNARGFTLEPHTAYFPEDASRYFKSEKDKKLWKYIWQRHWMWYYCWGRIAYSVNLPESTVIAEYSRHYGAAGPRVYKAMQACGPILPLVLGYRYQGPDHRQYSPETQVALYWDLHSGGRPKGPGVRTILNMARHIPMDDSSFISIDDFIDNKIEGRADGRVGPFQVCALLDKYAEDGLKSIAAVPPLSGRAADTWHLLKADLLGSVHLARYYSARLKASAYLYYALRTGSAEDYRKARSLMKLSREEWRKLSESVDPVYAPLLNKLVHQDHFKWADELKFLEKIDAEQAPEKWPELGDEEVMALLSLKTGPVADAPPLKLTRNEIRIPFDVKVSNLKHKIADKSFAVSCGVGSPYAVKEVLLWVRDMPSTASWKTYPMKSDGAGNYEVSGIPSYIHGNLYKVEVRLKDGGGIQYPNPIRRTPWVVITESELKRK